MQIELLRLPKQGRVGVTFFPAGEDTPTWTLGPTGSINGLQVVSGLASGVALQRLVFSPRRLELIPENDIARLQLNLHLRCRDPVIGGHIDLREGAVARFCTAFDEVTIMGDSSWYCRIF